MTDEFFHSDRRTDRHDMTKFTFAFRDCLVKTSETDFKKNPSKRKVRQKKKALQIQQSFQYYRTTFIKWL